MFHSPMKKRGSLAALSLIASLVPVSFAQTTTSDPYLDALVEEEQKKNEVKISDTQAANAETKVESGSGSSAASPQLYDPSLASMQDAQNQLAGDTGIFSNELAHEGKTISQVKVEFITSRKHIPQQRLLSQISLKAGQPYSSTRANADLERLIAEGLIASDARLAVYPTANNRVRVVFEVGSRPLIGGIGFEGNTMFTDADLRDQVEIKSGTMINDKDFASARQAILKFYHEARYPSARVTWEERATRSGQYRDIIFKVQEGPRGEIVDISFKGNNEFDSEQLRQVMKVQEKGMLYFFTGSGRYSEHELSDDLTALVNHYRNFGYLRAQISDVKYYNVGTKEHEKLQMVVSISEGPRYRIRKVDFQGNTVFNHAELEPALSMIAGDIYSLKKVSDDVRLVRSYYGSKGYADASVYPDIVEAGTDSKGMRLIDITYKLNEGKAYRVGRLNVRGNTRTRPHVILRELPVKSGAPMNSVDLETARTRLTNLGYFGNVQVSQATSSTPGYRDVNIDVAERRTGDLSFGVSFSTEQSVSLFVNVTQSNFDIRGLRNGVLVGGGQRLTMSANIGTEYQTASIFLLEPWFLDQKLAFGNELFYSSANFLSDYYSQKNFGFSTSLRYALGDASSMELKYKFERYELTPEGAPPPYFQNAIGDYNRSHLSLGYKYDTRNASILPRSGGHVEFIAGYSGPGSTVQTYGLDLTGSYYYNSFWDTIFSVRFNMKTIDTVDSNEQVPIFEAAYLGGSHDLRGFRYRDVGIVNEALAGNETMGGQTSFYAQFEVTVPIIDNIRLAAFFDAGFVHADSFDFAPELWAADVGIGIRLTLPIGPLAADFAIPVASDNAIDNGAQFQFYADYEY